MVAPPPTLESLPDSVRGRLRHIRLLFGHQSVGANVLTGVRELAEREPQVSIDIRAHVPNALAADGINHFVVGTNGDPGSKGASFAQAVASGAPPSSLAGYELCYLDFTADADADAIFAEYQRVTNSVRAQNPDIRLVHFTAPLTVEEPRMKGLVKRLLGRSTTRALNAKRNRYNARMRATYLGWEPLFDLASAESTLEDGTRSVATEDGEAVESLSPAFAADEGHLNRRGRRVVASRFLAFLASLPGLPSH